MRVGAYDNDACRMPVLDSNACLGVMSLGMVGSVRSTIMSAGASQAEESGQICGGVKKSSALAHSVSGR